MSQTARATMLIRRPPGEVFAAFVNPQMLRKFWLRDATGPLAPRARVQWDFMVSGASETVAVTDFESPHLIGFDWSNGMHVRLEFEAFDDEATKLSVVVNGFRGDVLKQATAVIEGFSVVFCDLKTLLETGTSAGLVRDKAVLIEAAIRGGSEV